MGMAQPRVSQPDLAGDSHFTPARIGPHLAARRHGRHLQPPACAEPRSPGLVALFGVVDLAGDAGIVQMVDGKIAAGPKDPLVVFRPQPVRR